MIIRRKQRGRRPKSGKLYLAESDRHGPLAVYCANSDVVTGLGTVNFVYTYRPSKRLRDGRPVLGRPEWLTSPFLVTDEAWTKGHLQAWPGDEPVIEDAKAEPVIFNSTFQEFRDCRHTVVEGAREFDTQEVIRFGDDLGETLEEACEAGFTVVPPPLTRENLGHRGYPKSPRNEFWHD
ncbi:MAG: hypothetical protein K2Q20_03420 [Phycisphaerales bacterium]|nr:hypothetical protein [Phycisphaerales bacterium]